MRTPVSRREACRGQWRPFGSSCLFNRSFALRAIGHAEVLTPRTHTVRNVNCGPAPGVILPVVTRRLFLLAAVAAAALYAEDFTGKVVAISDAATIRVMHNGASAR